MDLGKLCRVHDFEDVFNFVQEHDFLRAVDFGPVPEKPQDDLETSVTCTNKNSNITYLFCQSSVLFQKLDDAIRQLRVVHAEALHFVERDENSGQEQLVLFLEGQRKPVDDGTKDL